MIDPLTNRRIRQRSISPTSSEKSKWRELMLERGGYLAHNGFLEPLRMADIVDWDTEIDDVLEDRESEEIRKYDPQSASSCLIVNPDVGVPSFTESLLSVVDVCPEDLPVADNLLLVHKPAGLLTLPGIGPSKSECLASRVTKWLESTEDGKNVLQGISCPKIRKKWRKKAKPHVPRPCHRLDQDTSGLIVVALTQEAQRCGQMLFEKRKIDKMYVALVAGHINEEYGSVEFSIGKVAAGGGHNAFACEVPNQEGAPFIEGTLRSAKTEWRVSARLSVAERDAPSTTPSAHYTRVELKPVTGRGHQLRLHMAAIGHPILGDKLHAPPSVANAAPRLCLHAESLIFPVRASANDDTILLASGLSPAPF